MTTAKVTIVRAVRPDAVEVTATPGDLDPPSAKVTIVRAARPDVVEVTAAPGDLGTTEHRTVEVAVTKSNTEPSVMAHAHKHIMSGADQIDADRLYIAFEPAGYDRELDLSDPKTQVEHLRSHLAGIGSQFADVANDVDELGDAVVQLADDMGTLSASMALLSPLLLPLVTYLDSITLQASDGSKCLLMSKVSALAVTVPPNSSVAFPIGTIVNVVRYGAGALTFIQGAGVTIRSADSSITAGSQYTIANLIKIAVNEWLLVGTLA
jgi:hypothetical protein